MQPSVSKTPRLLSSTSVTRLSTGRPPRFLDHATRTPLKSRPSGLANRAPGSVVVIGERLSGPAMAERRNAASSTERASGPITDIVAQASAAGYDGTRPGVGRKPTTLLKLPGLRRLPPRSEPSAKGSIAQATATAAPPDEPPHVLSRS